MVEAFIYLWVASTLLMIGFLFGMAENKQRQARANRQTRAERRRRAPGSDRRRQFHSPSDRPDADPRCEWLAEERRDLDTEALAALQQAFARHGAEATLPSPIGLSLIVAVIGSRVSQPLDPALLAWVRNQVDQLPGLDAAERQRLDRMILLGGRGPAPPPVLIAAPEW